MRQAFRGILWRGLELASLELSLFNPIELGP